MSNTIRITPQNLDRALAKFSQARINGQEIALNLDKNVIFKGLLTGEASHISAAKIHAQTKAAAIIAREQAAVSQLGKSLSVKVLELNKYLEATQKGLAFSKKALEIVEKTADTHWDIGLDTEELDNKANSFAITILNQETAIARLRAERDAAAAKLLTLGTGDHRAQVELLDPTQRAALHNKPLSEKELIAAQKPFTSVANRTFVGREVQAFLKELQS